MEKERLAWERLRPLRESKGLSLDDVAGVAGRDRGWLSRLERGQFKREPAHWIVGALARGLKVDESQILTLIDAPPEFPPDDEESHPEPLPYDELLRRIGAMPDVPETAPFYEDLVAHMGRGGSFPGDVIDALPSWMDKKTIEDLQNRFRLRAHGTCMEPDINDRDIVVFDKRIPPEPGRIVAALVNMEETIIRRVVEREGYKLLVANSGHDPIPVDWRVQIAAVAVGGQYTHAGGPGDEPGPRRCGRVGKEE